MPGASTCPKCGAPLPGEGWAGLCPKCLVRVSLEAEAEGPAPILQGPTPSGSERGQAAESNPEAEKHMAGTPAQSASAPKPDVLLERTGMVIGRYKLLQQIGEGGFGVVFMAEQTEPVQRKVALKIVKAGMDTREIIARFEA